MIRVLQQDGVTIIELDERYDSLDEQSLEEFGTILLEAASSASPPALLLDLTNTRFIGSRFIGLLVRAWKRVQDRKGRMGLCNIPAFCREALISTRLYNTLWTPYETRQQAIAAMN
ncbi:MAG: STAS domain-containing protein [Planctomycetaceae bacterium]|nr:STAS domain-containing protein [Planctomycetaceae bacterium]